MHSSDEDLVWKRWLDHFRTNATAPIPSPDRTEPLSGSERRLIARSIATFQLGESSDGRYLLHFSGVAAEHYGARDLPEITAHFVREEQLHARLLGSFMDAENIPRRESHWSDAVFRLLRRLGGYEVAVCVLVSAELIGIVYYRALARATGSRWLQAICNRLLADERHHVRYEAEVLRLLRDRRSPIGQWCAHAAHRMLFLGATLVVLVGHHRVLRAGGLAPVAYLRACDREFRCLFAGSSDETRAEAAA